MATRTLCLSLLVVLCLAHTTLSLAIPAHGRYNEPVPSSPLSDVSATTLEARNLAGEKTLVQRATKSPGGNGGNHDFLVRGETRKETPYIRPLSRGAALIKRQIWSRPDIFKYAIFRQKYPERKDPKASTRPHMTPLSYAALREQMLKDDAKPRRTSQSAKPPAGRNG